MCEPLDSMWITWCDDFHIGIAQWIWRTFDGRSILEVSNAVLNTNWNLVHSVETGFARLAMHALSDRLANWPLKCRSKTVGLSLVQTRSSRQSVDKHNQLVRLKKNYLPQEPNPRRTLPTLETPVSLIDPKTGKYKTSITVDILGTETFPQLTDWRKSYLISKSRRLLPLPVSLTGLGDGHMPRFWRQVMKKSLFKFDKHQRWSKLSLRDKMSVSLRTYLDHFEDRVRTKWPQLYDSYLDSKHSDGNQTTEPKADCDTSPQFPYLLVSHLKNSIKSVESKHLSEEAIAESNRPRLLSGLIDNEYDNYLKHHNLVQYLAASFKGFKSDEYEGEIEGWADQLWRRYVLLFIDSVNFIFNLWFDQKLWHSGPECSALSNPVQWLRSTSSLYSPQYSGLYAFRSF